MPPGFCLLLIGLQALSPEAIPAAADGRRAAARRSLSHAAVVAHRLPSVSRQMARASSGVSANSSCVRTMGSRNRTTKPLSSLKPARRLPGGTRRIQTKWTKGPAGLSTAIPAGERPSARQGRSTAGLKACTMAASPSPTMLARRPLALSSERNAGKSVTPPAPDKASANSSMAPARSPEPSSSRKTASERTLEIVMVPVTRSGKSNDRKQYPFSLGHARDLPHRKLEAELNHNIYNVGGILRASRQKYSPRHGAVDLHVEGARHQLAILCQGSDRLSCGNLHG